MPWATFELGHHQAFAELAVILARIKLAVGMELDERSPPTDETASAPTSS